MGGVEQEQLLQAGGQGPAGCRWRLERRGQGAASRVEARPGQAGPSVSPPYLTALTHLQGPGCREGWVGVIWQDFPLALQGLRDMGKGEAWKPAFPGAVWGRQPDRRSRHILPRQDHIHLRNGDVHYRPGIQEHLDHCCDILQLLTAKDTVLRLGVQQGRPKPEPQP